tara:strand:+ start:1298 stop:1948 length:651 start_codon:yes stop_codon:yes gene_type:complete
MSTIKTNQLAHTANGAATYTLPQTDGSAGQVLKTDGSGNLSWVTLPSQSDCVKLAAATGTSAVGQLLFQNLDVTNYRTFKIILSAYPTVDGDQLRLRVLDGSTYKTGAGTYNWAQSGLSETASGADSYAVIGNSAGNNNYEGWRTEITYVPHVSGDPAYQNNFGFAETNRYTTGNAHRGETYHFKFHQSDVTDGIELYASSGNIAAYSYTLYGLRR